VLAAFSRVIRVFGQAKGRLLFVNKKKQKNFFMLGHGLVADNAHGPA
jgi:hypothetical protein